jgi:hypothetical protein
MYKLIYVCVYVTTCMNSLYVCLSFVWTWYMLLHYVRKPHPRCACTKNGDAWVITSHIKESHIMFCFRLCHLLQTKCILCFLSGNNGWADVSMPITTVDSSSDGQMMSARPSLLRATVVMGVFVPSLLSYHYSNALVLTGRLPMATVTYGSFLQCLVVVVHWRQQTRCYNTFFNK